MVTNNIPQEEAAGSRRERRPFFETSRRIMLASIGALALAQDEFEDFVDRLVERGEMAEKEGRAFIDEMKERRRRTAQEVEVRMSKRMENVLSRLDIPTKEDIDALNARVAELTKKIDELKKTS